MEKIIDTKKESGEDYVRKILEFLEAAQEARRKKKKDEDHGIKWKVSAEVFQPAGEKGEAEKNDGGEGVRQMKLYPQIGLMVIYSNGLSVKEQGQEIKEKGETGQDKTQQIGQTRD